MCDKDEFKKLKEKGAKDMKEHGQKKMDLMGMKKGSSTCSDSAMKKAQTVLSSAGSCAPHMAEALRSKGFEAQKDKLMQGAKNGIKECKNMTTDKLEDMLAASDEMLEKGEEFKQKAVAEAGGKATFAGAMVRGKKG